MSSNCTNCREGSPKCLLGQITDPKYAPKHIQIDGRPAADIINKYKNSVSVKDHYKIMIIGMNPGIQEDRLDVPFVGPSGDFLCTFIKSSGMPIEDTFVTNISRCKTPKNRNPTSTEIKACLPYLYEEIKKYNPTVIMLLGNVALRLFHMNKDGGISNLRGKIFKKKLPDWEESPEFTIIPSFHPATYCYRDNKKQRELEIEDFRLAATLATGIEIKKNIYQAKYEVCKSVEDIKQAIKILEDNVYFSVDTESPDLDFMYSPMMLIQFSAGINKTFLIPFYSHDPDSTGKWKLKPYWNNEDRIEIVAAIKNLFNNRQLKCILHFAKYDILVIKRWLDIDIKCEVFDTQIMHHLLYEYPPHGLKELADFEFQAGDWEAPVREFLGGSEGDSNLSWDNCPDEILYPYAANDAEYTYRLFEPYWGELNKKPHLLKVYYEESLPAIFALVKAEWMGNKIDLEKVDEMEILYKKRLEDLLQECRKLTGNLGFNPQSPDQVAKAFRNLDVPEITEKINSVIKAKGYSVAKEVLLEIEDPLAENILQYRKYNKLISTYINRVREDIDENNRVRYSFKITGTTGSRLSCRFLHQIPRIDKDKLAKDEVILRQIFIEDEGYDILYLDFSLLELFVFAYKSGEQELIEALEQGKDIHRITASASLRIPLDEVSEFNRSVGKVLNFGTLYGSEGGQVSKLEFENPQRNNKRERVGFDRAKEFINNFRNKYKKVDSYLNNIVLQTLANGCIYRNEFGREKRIPELTTSDEYKYKKLERDIMSFSIQSSAGSICVKTMNKLDSIFDEYGLTNNDVRLINTVHDSLMYGCKTYLTDWLVKTARTVAQRPIPELYGKCFKAKVGVGKSWSEAEINAK